MLRRVFLFTSVLWTACASGDARSGARGSGRFVLTRTTPARQILLDMPALARYCGRDSVLSVVAIGDRWSAVVALRTPWPAQATQFPIAFTLGGPGAAAVAARSLADSTSLIGRSGTVTVRPGALLAGHLDAEVPGDSGRTTRLSGQFTDLTVRTGECP